MVDSTASASARPISGAQQLANGIGRERVGHQGTDLARQAAAAGNQRSTSPGQVRQEGQHASVAAIDVVDQQQDRPPAEQVAHGLTAVFERPGQQAGIVEGARDRLQQRTDAAAIATRDPHEGVEHRRCWDRLPAASGGLAGVGDRVQQCGFARSARAFDADDRAARLAQPAQQRSHLVFAADEPHVLGQRPVGRQRPFHDLGPQVLAERADGGAPIPIERRLVA
jgi:hypothetical protein